MRAFIISLILICVMITCAVLNNIYIIKITDQMLCAIDSMPDKIVGASESVRAPYLIWEENSEKLSLTINFRFIDGITAHALSASVNYDTGDLSSYLTSKASLRDAIEDLRKCELISFFGIF